MLHFSALRHEISQRDGSVVSGDMASLRALAPRIVAGSGGIRSSAAAAWD
jgi:hypothetical protein